MFKVAHESQSRVLYTKGEAEKRKSYPNYFHRYYSINANLGYLLAGTNHTVTTNNAESRKRKKKCFPQTFSSSVYVLS